MCLFFHKTLVLALTQLIRFQQQDNAQEDLIGSEIRQIQFPVRQLAKGAKLYLLLGEEEDGEGSL